MTAELEKIQQDMLEKVQAILANGSQSQTPWRKRTPSLSWLGHKNSAPKLANHIEMGIPATMSLDISYIFADSGYSLQLSRRSFLQQKDFWGEGDSGASDFPSFFREPKIKDFSASKKCDFLGIWF